MSGQLHVVVLSYLFPNSAAPNSGVFVLNRVRAVQNYCRVTVINPIPWFPFSSRLTRYRNYDNIPRTTELCGVTVHHPRFFSIPRYCKFIEAVTYPLAVVLIMVKQRLTRASLLDLHWTYPDLVGGWVAKKLFGKEMVVTLRGVEAFHLEERTVRRFLIRRLLPRAARVIALSDGLLELAARHDVERHRLRVIRNGVDTHLFHILDQERCRNELGLPAQRKIILAVGSLANVKGFDRLIAAMPDVLQEHPGALAIIVGSAGPAGDCGKDLRGLVGRLGLSDCVRFAGSVANRDLVCWYNAADLFCLSSRSEGSPNVLTEALACGCPAVATEVGSVKEILTEPFMGEVVGDPALLGAALKKNLRRLFDRERIAASLQRYDWDWCARQVMENYREALGGQRGE